PCCARWYRRKQARRGRNYLHTRHPQDSRGTCCRQRQPAREAHRAIASRARLWSAFPTDPELRRYPPCESLQSNSYSLCPPAAPWSKMESKVNCIQLKIQAISCCSATLSAKQSKNGERLYDSLDLHCFAFRPAAAGGSGNPYRELPQGQCEARATRDSCGTDPGFQDTR